MAKKSLITQYLDKENRLDIVTLQKAELDDLYKLSEELKIENYNQLKRNELIFQILQSNPEEGGLIKAHGCLPAIAINASTPMAELEHVIHKLDMILIMSVNAGFGGQRFMPETLEKVRLARQLIDSTHKDIRLEIDGGINAETIISAAEAGADTFVAGSAIFNSDDYAATIKALRNNASLT